MWWFVGRGGGGEDVSGKKIEAGEEEPARGDSNEDIPVVLIIFCFKTSSAKKKRATIEVHRFFSEVFLNLGA